MGEININDFVKVAGMASMNGFRRFMKWQGELIADRAKFIVIENSEGQPVLVVLSQPISIEDIEDYSTVLEELFLHYIPSYEYACLNLDERVSLRNTYIELKTFIDKLIEIRDMSLTAKTA
jgi:hypothetical protein